MTQASEFQLRADLPRMPAQVERFPRIRYMGSKIRLLPWIFDILSAIEFDTALDAFSGSGCVAYLLKSMGKQVTANDFLKFSSVIAAATIANSNTTVSADDLASLLHHDRRHKRFIEQTYSGIFFTPQDLRFLDLVSWNIRGLEDASKRSLALAAMIRACAKRQPRGVFTVAGDPERYKDGRRDLQLSIQQHFIEHITAYNNAVFSNDRKNHAINANVFDLEENYYDLVYLDPPYVPRSDDNCYMKRYHFLEGLSCYWEGIELLHDTRVKKIKKPFTPFSYRRTAIEAFENLFAKFARSIIVLSYSSNGFPDLTTLVDLMKKHKREVEVHRRKHRYHFGTHAAAQRNQVEEYLIIGH